jgi:hypothetical protein
MSAGTPEASHPEGYGIISGLTPAASETEFVTVRRQRFFSLVALLIRVVWIGFAAAHWWQST